MANDKNGVFGFGKQNPVLAKRWQDKNAFLARFGKKIRFWQSFGNFFFETCLLADFSGDGCGPPLYITVFFMVPLCFFLISDGDATSLVLFKFIDAGFGNAKSACFGKLRAKTLYTPLGRRPPGQLFGRAARQSSAISSQQKSEISLFGGRPEPE